MRTIGYNSRTSWIVALGASVIGFLLMIPMRLAGLLFIIIIDRYDTDRTRATIPITMFGMLRSLTGPFVGYLGHVFGLRRITIVGCIMSTVGVGACFFAEDIVTVIIYLGLIYGVGFGLGSTLIPEILKQHFSQDINLVNGIFLTGSCLGAVIMPKAVMYLIYQYGYSGMFLLLSGILLNTVPAALLFKNPRNDEYEAKLKREEVLNNQIKETSPNQNALSARIRSKSEPVYSQNQNTLSDMENFEVSVVEKQIYTNNKLTKEFHETGFSEFRNPNSENNVAAACKPYAKLDPALIDGNLCSNIKPKDIDNLGTKYNFNELSKNNSVRSADMIMFNKCDTLSNIVSNDCDSDPKSGKVSNHNKNIDIETCQKEANDGANTNKTDTRRQLLELFLDPTFHLTMTIQSTHAFISTLNWTILLDYARDKGISPSTSLYFLMFLPLSEIVGSLSLSWVSDRDYMSRTKYCMVCNFCLSALSVCMVYTFSYATMMIVVLLFGFISGSLGATFPGMIHEFIEEEQQGMALASRFLLYAFLCITKSPIIGYFRGTLGSYKWVYFIIAMCCLFGGIIVNLTPVFATMRRNKKLKNKF